MDFIKKHLSFYFAPRLTIIVKVIYFVVFGYFVIFYSYNIILAIKFAWWTIFNTSSLFGLNFLFWSTIFVTSMIVPFIISLYSLVIPHDILNKSWLLNEKIIGFLIYILTVILLLIIFDQLIGVAATKLPTGSIIGNEAVKVLFY